MKKLMIIITVLINSIVFLSCADPPLDKNYRFASDGLIYYKNTDKLFTGLISDSSSVIMEYEVVEGKKNGSFLVYYPNGKLAQSGYLINNKNEGEWSYYYSNGNLECRGIYINDVPQGQWFFYFSDGSLKSYGSFTDGNKHGVWVLYKENGTLQNIYFYSNGKLADTHFKQS